MLGLLPFNYDTEVIAIVITILKGEEVLDCRIAIWVLLVVALPTTILLELSTTAGLVLDARRALARER